VIPEMLPARWRTVGRRVGSVILILIVFLVVALVGRTIWTFQGYPFDADEAIHANSALAMMLDLRAGDLKAFVSTVYGQGFYPPAFSVLKAVTFLAFGASAQVARAFSLACLPLALVMIYLTSRELDEHWGWLVGGIAVALTLTSQFLLITSALVMMEVPGLLATFGFLWLYVRALEKPTAARLSGTSVLLAVTFLTKYTYGVAAVATVGLMEVSQLLFGQGEAERRRQGTLIRVLGRRWVWLLGPFILIIAVWFAKPYKIAEFWSYATAQPSHRSWSLQTLLFYPRSIALHYSPSPVFALVMLIGVIWAVGRWRRPVYRLFLIYFAVGMGEMTLNFPKSPRFISTFVPAAHALTGAMMVACLNRWHQSPLRRWRKLVALLVLVSLLAAIPVLVERYRTYPSLMEVSYETHPKLKTLAAWIQSQVPAGERFFVINFWDQLSPWALTWHLGTHEVPPGTRFEDISLPSALLKDASPENIELLREEIRASGVRYVVAFEGAPWGAPVWWVYAGEMSDMLEPVNQKVLYVDLYDTGDWLRRSLLTKHAWERVKEEGRFTLQVKTTVYAVAEP